MINMSDFWLAVRPACWSDCSTCHVGVHVTKYTDGVLIRWPLVDVAGAPQTIEMVSYNIASTRGGLSGIRLPVALAQIA